VTVDIKNLGLLLRAKILNKSVAFSKEDIDNFLLLCYTYYYKKRYNQTMLKGEVL